VEKWKSLWKTPGESGTTIFGKSLKREKRENTENILTAENEPDLVGLTDKKEARARSMTPAWSIMHPSDSCLLYQYMRLRGIYTGESRKKNQ